MTNIGYVLLFPTLHFGTYKSLEANNEASQTLMSRGREGG